MLFTGVGWGKSCAALGYAMRAAGRGWPATVVQFVKGAAWNAAEASAGAGAGVEWRVFTPGLTWGRDDPRDVAARAWSSAGEVLRSDQPGLVVLDELTHAIESGWLAADLVAQEIADRNPLTSVIITGRTAPDPLRDIADTITGFELVKHDAKKGILGP